jgi:hypothetical protein
MRFQTQPNPCISTQKGRNAGLLQRRDQKLIRRFYYWFETRRRRLDDVLKILSQDEFFISEGRIMEIIKENDELLNSLYQKN